MKAVAPAPQPDYDPENLITLSVAGRMLGFEGGDAMRRRYAAENNLTIVDLSRPGAQRPTLRMVLSEVIAHRREKIHNARRRTDVHRFKLVKNG